MAQYDISSRRHKTGSFFAANFFGRLSLTIIASTVLISAKVQATTELRQAVSPAFKSGNLLQHARWGQKRNRVLFVDSSRQRPLQSGLTGNQKMLTSLLLGGDQIRGGSEEADDKEDDETKDENETEEDADESVDDGDEDEDENESDVEDEYDAEDDEEYEEEGLPLGVDMEESSEFDEPLIASPMLGMYATIGVLVLAAKIDLFNPTTVRMARFAFVGYLVLMQVFLLYIRIKAKAENNRTPVKTTNPLNSILQSQLQGQDNSNAMMKNLASSFLSSESTVMEYDLKHAKGMQGGMLFNMCLMWLLHFKMEQVQPLLVTTVTGIINLVYNPLFQVYVLGRNLERPFRNPAMEKQQAAMQGLSADPSESAATETVESETTIDDESEADSSAESSLKVDDDDDASGEEDGDVGEEENLDSDDEEAES